MTHTHFFQMVRGTTPTWRDSSLEWKLLVWALSTCTSLKAWRKARYMATGDGGYGGYGWWFTSNCRGMVIGCYCYNLFEDFEATPCLIENKWSEQNQAVASRALFGWSKKYNFFEPTMSFWTNTWSNGPETRWLLGWFFLSDLGRRTCTAIPATSAEHRQGGHLAVALAVELAMVVGFEA